MKFYIVNHSNDGGAPMMGRSIKNVLVNQNIKANLLISEIRTNLFLNYSSNYSKIIQYLDEKFNGNENYKKIVNSSAFCTEKNNIVSDNYKITNNEKIGIIPPIGGG